MFPHPSKNFEIQKYYQNETNLNLVVFVQKIIYLKQSMSHMSCLDEYESIGFHWIALYANGNSIIYFGSFGGEHIPKKS